MNKTMAPIVLVVALLALAVPVVVVLTRIHIRLFGARAKYHALALEIGVPWFPDQTVDLCAPGCIKGHYRAHMIVVGTKLTGPGGNQTPESMIHVYFAHPLGLGLVARSGAFREFLFRPKRNDYVYLTNERLTKRLRPRADDRVGTSALLDSRPVTDALLKLDRKAKGVELDDNMLTCMTSLPLSVNELRATLDEVVDAVVLFDNATSRRWS